MDNGRHSALCLGPAGEAGSIIFIFQLLGNLHVPNLIVMIAIGMIMVMMMMMRRRTMMMMMMMMVGRGEENGMVLCLILLLIVILILHLSSPQPPFLLTPITILPYSMTSPFFYPHPRNNTL